MVFGTVSYSGGLDLENGLLTLGTAYKGVNVEEEIREIYYTTDLLTKELFPLLGPFRWGGVWPEQKEGQDVKNLCLKTAMTFSVGIACKELGKQLHPVLAPFSLCPLSSCSKFC